jgi:hypothetical protein
MSTTLLTAGLACVIAAIVGGGLKAFGLELPILASRGRQGLLATFGIILMVGAYYAQESGKGPSLGPDREILLFDTKNNDAVLNGPPEHAEFTISQSYYITDIWNYHYNGGQGVTPGNISLRRSDGKVFGPWEVSAADVTTKINWECQPKTTLPAGTYTIIDSEDALWSWNDRTGRRGMSKVKGYPAFR